MKPRIAIAVLKILFQIGFYLLLVFTVLFFILSIMNIAGAKTNLVNNMNHGLTFFVRSFNAAPEAAIQSTNTDTAHYRQLTDRYIFQTNPNTPAGYYTVIIKLIYLCLGLAVLKLLIQIVKKISVEKPFHWEINKYFRLLALLFISNDLIKCIDYLILGRIMHNQFPGMHFQLETEIGNGFVTGLIIWVVAFVYARGTQLQKEQEYTI
ncbi:MAG: DUF2975 domain-containing protein [Niabella sp.]|nr:DUF2975 domain-containing protein [Niabella sp.]